MPLVEKVRKHNTLESIKKEKVRDKGDRSMNLVTQLSTCAYM